MRCQRLLVSSQQSASTHNSIGRPLGLQTREMPIFNTTSWWPVPPDVRLLQLASGSAKLLPATLLYCANIFVTSVPQSADTGAGRLSLIPKRLAVVNGHVS